MASAPQRTRVTMASAAAIAPVIETSGLGRTYGRRVALSDVTITVAAGEVFGVVGPDGAGKSTLLQMIAGILKPSSGDCIVLGHDVRRRADRVQATIGYMSQGFSLYDRLTVAENLAFAGSIRDVEGALFTERKRALLQMAGLQRFEARREGALSGGMRKKLALCANLIHEPPLLVLDEPSLGVDPLSRRELWRMLDAARSAGRSIIFATSYMDEADASDHVLLLKDGRPLAYGAPSELRGRANERIFSVIAQDPKSTECALTNEPAVLSFQKRSAGSFRVQLASPAPPTIEGATFTNAEPSMEDLFTVMSADGRRDLERGAIPPPTALATSSLISALGITQRFGDFIAVDNISLDIKAGEVLGLLGPNGAGKTTLIRILCGLLTPSAGHAKVAEFDVARQSAQVRTRIGYVSQRFSLFADLTARENLRFFAHAYGLPQDSIDERITWAAVHAGLDEVSDALVRDLSGAIRQRLALACAIVHRPRVLFLDEPTSGVDPISRFRFWRLISSLAAAGAAIIVSTHYLEEATYCDRLGLMMDGRMIALDTLDNLQTALGLTDASVEDVFMGFITRERARQAADARTKGGVAA
ncbi:MAG TPA: ATP-binding cassette domain-containing protein [Caulobacterales bacterium]|nr:ATP-binding cassette domain-containing protein [Caulobacterales bacterium]